MYKNNSLFCALDASPYFAKLNISGTSYTAEFGTGLSSIIKYRNNNYNILCTFI